MILRNYNFCGCGYHPKLFLGSADRQQALWFRPLFCLHCLWSTKWTHCWPGNTGAGCLPQVGPPPHCWSQEKGRGVSACAASRPLVHHSNNSRIKYRGFGKCILSCMAMVAQGLCRAVNLMPVNNSDNSYYSQQWKWSVLCSFGSQSFIQSCLFQLLSTRGAIVS